MGSAAGNRYLELRRSLLPPGRVRELSRCRPRQVVRDTAVQWAIILAAFGTAALIHTWWGDVLAAAIVGNRYYSLWIIAHDGLHRRLFDKPATNDLFCDAFALAPIGAITRINNRNHLRHHKYLGSEEDPDRHKHGCFNKATRPALIAYVTAVSSIALSVRHVLSRATPRGDLVEAPELRPSYEARDLALLLGWQAVLLASLWLLFGWWAYVLMWWLPVFVFVFLADNLRTFVEHSQPAADAVADDRRLVTNNPGWIERQLLSPMNMNYHAAHHLWPSIPYYNLPQADAEMRQSPLAGAITWRRSYLRYLGRYFGVLPLADCLSAPTGA